MEYDTNYGTFKHDEMDDYYDYYRDYNYSFDGMFDMFDPAKQNTSISTKDIHARIADYLAISFAAAAILVNVPTICVLCWKCGKLTCHLRFVLNQCILDLAMAIFYVFNPFLSRLPLWATILIDEFYPIITWLICINLTLMTLDQFFAIARQLRYPDVVTRKRVNATLYGSYGLAAFYYVMFFVGLEITRKTEGEMVHDNFFTWYMLHHLYKLLFIRQFYVSVALLIVCSLTLFGVYGYILHVVFRTGSETRAKQAAKAKRKAVVVSFLVVVSFVVCTVFHFVYFNVPLAAGNTSDPLAIYTYPLLALNCLFDPLVYAIRLDKIKEGYRKAWAEIRCKGRHDDHDHSLSSMQTTRTHTNTQTDVNASSVDRGGAYRKLSEQPV